MPPIEQTENTAGTAVVDTTTTAAPPAAPAPPAPPVEPVMSERERVMNQIAQINDERIDAEHVAEGLAPIIAAAPKPADTPAPPAPTPAPADDQLAAQLGDGITFVTPEQLSKLAVREKVDGVEKIVTLDVAVREHQKHGAADNRLDTANKLLKEARERTATPPVGIDTTGAPAQTPAPSTTPAPPAPAAEGKKKFVKALFEGDEDGALQALDEVIGEGRQQPIQIDQLASQVTPVIRQRMSDEDALTEFGKTYSDIATDPHLATMADAYLDAAQKEGKPFSEALTYAGQQVRGWLESKGIRAPAAPPAAPPAQADIDRTQKLAAKEGIDNLPSLNRAASTAEPVVETHSDVIAQMKAARGLA